METSRISGGAYITHPFTVRCSTDTTTRADRREVSASAETLRALGSVMRNTTSAEGSPTPVSDTACRYCGDRKRRLATPAAPAPRAPCRRRAVHCFSNSATLFTACPWAFVPFVVTVIVFPSLETTRLRV